MRKLKKIFVILALVVTCCSLYAAQDEPKKSADTQKTQVVIIGGIHGKHNENPNYSSEKLKQIILLLKPAAILNELPLSLVEPNGRPIKRLRNKDVSPESWAADEVATQLGIRQIPFDRPDRQENFKKTNYFKRQKRWNKLANKWGEQVNKDDPNSIDLKIANLMSRIGQSEWHLFMNGTAEIINSEAHDSIIRVKHSLWYEILPEIFEKYPGYETLIDEYHFARDQWRQRNKIMVENIIKAATKYPGKRLVVVTGATHRYILRDLLKDEKSIELKEYWEVIKLSSDNQVKWVETKEKKNEK